jgi:processive 1,2-diacylglycerol beta-glucosyltransferase
MIKYGVNAEKISVLGIPIDPVFSKRKGKEALVKKLGIKGELFTVLVGSGGFGVGPIEELVKAFKGISVPVELLVVCGKNEALRVAIEGAAKDIGVPMKVYGFVDNMDELMEVSDVIITKTGGLMSSEALAKDLPIIGIAPIPGQETRNFEILVRLGVVMDGKNVQEIPKIITDLYNDKALLSAIKEKIKEARKPEAARDIARLALGI